MIGSVSQSQIQLNSSATYCWDRPVWTKTLKTLKNLNGEGGTGLRHLGHLRGDQIISSCGNLHFGKADVCQHAANDKNGDIKSKTAAKRVPFVVGAAVWPFSTRRRRARGATFPPFGLVAEKMTSFSANRRLEFGDRESGPTTAPSSRANRRLVNRLAAFGHQKRERR